MVAIPLGSFWRSQPIDGLLGPHADDSMVDVSGKPYGWTFYPMIFMFFTTTAALVVTAWRLSKQVYLGAVKGEALVGTH